MSEIENKVAQYEAMLRTALAFTEVVAGQRYSNDFILMARSYCEDGAYFKASGDLVNALVCFSYGHGWLDAGVRVGALKSRQGAPRNHLRGFRDAFLKSRYENID